MKQTTLSAVSLNITDGKHGDCVNEENSGFYFVSCKDVKDGSINYESARQITAKDFLEANKRTSLAPNDILITNSGTIGRMAFVRDIPITYKTTFQKSVAIVKPNSDIIHPLYLYYQLQYCVERFINQSNGSAQKNLLLSTMRAFELFIHDDLEVQHQIADILSAYDDLIENNRKQIKLLEEAAQRLYKEWFVDLRFPGHEHTRIVDGVPEGWKNGCLSQIAEFKRGKTITKAQIKPGTIPVVAGGLEPAYYHNVANTKAPVITISASGANAGFTRMYHTDVFASDCSFIDKNTCACLPFVYCFLINHKSELDSLQKGSAQPHVYAKDINALQLCLPNSNLLNKFCDFSKRLFLKIGLLEHQSTDLTQARDHLLPKLMSGEMEM